MSKSKPVAGQPGYQNPEVKSAHVDVEHVDRELGAKEIGRENKELGPEAVQPKVKREAPPLTTMPPRDSTGKELRDYLRDTGYRGPAEASLRDTDAWLREHPNATCADLFHYLETAEDLGHFQMPQTTLRRAGKWIWGAAWELETAALVAPAEEINRLREQVARLEGELSKANSNVAAFRNQNSYLREENAELKKENEHLKLVARGAGELAGV